MFALAVLGMTSVLARAQDREQPVFPLSSIQVEMPPGGDIEIAYVESNEGMVLIAKCNGMSVKSQRLYLGDGKIAVMYEASTDGFFTPGGKANSAAIKLRKGDSVSCSSTKLEKWGTNRGAVYIHAEGFKFVTSDK
ncbi:hypothetical protein GC197_15955 [bacterium]|nr:hypothetical protein [bacterium]